MEALLRKLLDERERLAEKVKEADAALARAWAERAVLEQQTARQLEAERQAWARERAEVEAQLEAERQARSRERKDWQAERGQLLTRLEHATRRRSVLEDEVEATRRALSEGARPSGEAKARRALEALQAEVETLRTRMETVIASGNTAESDCLPEGSMRVVERVVEVPVPAEAARERLERLEKLVETQRALLQDAALGRPSSPPKISSPGAGLAGGPASPCAEADGDGSEEAANGGSRGKPWEHTIAGAPVAELVDMHAAVGSIKKRLNLLLESGVPETIAHPAESASARGAAARAADRRKVWDC